MTSALIVLVFGLTQWLTEVAILLGETVVEVSIATSSLESLCPSESRLATCFFGGSVKVDGEDIIRLGTIDMASHISVTLSNLNSFGRISVNAMKPWRFVGSVDYVPAPASWKLSGEDAAEFAHLNFKISKIALSSFAHGVIGQTSRVKYDSNGQAVRTPCSCPLIPKSNG